MRIEPNVPPVTIDGQPVSFKDWVLSLGDGLAPTYALDEDIEPSWVEIPKEIRVDYSGDPVKAIVDEIYPDLQQNHGDAEYLRGRAILTPLNEYVEKINREVLNRLPGSTKIYKSCDSICKGSATSAADDTLYPPEYLNTLKFSGMPNHEIELKEGVPIMLLRNLNPKKGLCNGTRLIVTQCYPFLIEGLIITGNKVGEKVYIPRINMTPADKAIPFKLKRKQFPIADEACIGYTKNIVYREIFNDIQ
ncbi:ATP-dependent DNA helicase [Heracleum sosnowskyi]|uniref:ATP-dependent DNA helicase n=1 Tax=Heracleum sosnowskyi TaxID=360622 RepID=A0AAD8GQ41_9APIA|nr:ATP-dependent DNA helicase [Heracleum sosnowskyi]